MLLIWYVVGTLVQYPHFISMPMSFCHGRSPAPYRQQHRLGQSLPDMAAYIQKIKPSHVSFFLLRQDNGNDYGLVSNRQWGLRLKILFHEIALPYKSGKRMIVISVSNWYGCGYSKEEKFSKQKIRSVIADSILIF
jgi:hypothetical protein